MDAERLRSFDLEWAWTASTKRGCCGMVAGQAFLWLSSWGRFGGESTRTLGMFMALQATPQRGPFSVLGFDSKKVVLLDWCFDEAVLSTATCCTKARLQSLSLSRKSTWAPSLLLVQGVPFERAKLMRRWKRLKIYSLAKPLARSSGHIVECPSCSAKLLLPHSL